MDHHTIYMNKKPGQRSLQPEPFLTGCRLLIRTLFLPFIALYMYKSCYLTHSSPLPSPLPHPFGKIFVPHTLWCMNLRLLFPAWNTFGFTVLLKSRNTSHGKHLLELSGREGVAAHLRGVWVSNLWAVGTWPPAAFLTRSLAGKGQWGALIAFPKDRIRACCTTQL